MILVGITGPAGSGKDTIADYLVQTHAFTKLSFASTLKAMMAAAGMPEPADRADKERPVPGFDFTWREAAQKLGTEWGRGLDQNIWTKLTGCAIQQINLNLCGQARIVLSDVRFNNEAARIRRMGGKVLHLTGRAADLGANASHASEAGVEYADGDYTIYNGNALDATTQQVRYALWGAQ